MSITPRMPICSKKILIICFSIYAALTLVSMAAMGISAFILILAIVLSKPQLTDLVQAFKAEWQRPPFRGYFIFSFILTTAAAASLLGAAFFPLGYGGKFVEVHFLKDMAKAWYFFWPCLLVIGLRQLNQQQQRTVLNTWLIAFGLLSALGIFQYFSGWPRPQPIPGEAGHYHATLFLGHHLSVASIFIFPFFVTLDLVYSKYRARLPDLQPQTRIGIKAYTAITVLGFLALLLTYSRTLWIALPLGIILWILLTLPKKLKVLASSLLLILALGVSQFPPIQKRLYDGIGIVTRQNLWLANLEFLKQRPLTGVGWHHNQELSGFYLMDKYKTNDVFSGHAHNNFLDLLGSQGSFGALAWLAWCVSVIWLLLRQRKTNETGTKTTFSRGLVCAWFVFQINGLTQVNFWEAKVEHQLAWVIAWSLL